MREIIWEVKHKHMPFKIYGIIDVEETLTAEEITDIVNRGVQESLLISWKDYFREVI